MIVASRIITDANDATPLNKIEEDYTVPTQFAFTISDKSLKETTLTITENSRPGYGFTNIHQLRLWHCYNCAQSFRNLNYDRNDKNFNEVLHNFDGTGVIGGKYQTFSDQAQGTTNTELMNQTAYFPGYSLNFDTGSPTLCDESSYQYYNEKRNTCDRHYNLARCNKDIEARVPSSRNGRYTMDFWFFVENSPELSPGVNLYWENHLSITLLRDTFNKYTINAICFPQSYKDNIDGLKGIEIMEFLQNGIL